MFLIFFYLIDFINIASLISLVDLRKRSNDFINIASLISLVDLRKRSIMKHRILFVLTLIAATAFFSSGQSTQFRYRVKIETKHKVMQEIKMTNADTVKLPNQAIISSQKKYQIGETEFIVDIKATLRHDTIIYASKTILKTITLAGWATVSVDKNDKSKLNINYWRNPANKFALGSKLRIDREGKIKEKTLKEETEFNVIHISLADYRNYIANKRQISLLEDKLKKDTTNITAYPPKSKTDSIEKIINKISYLKSKTSSLLWFDSSTEKIFKLSKSGDTLSIYANKYHGNYSIQLENREYVSFWFNCIEGGALTIPFKYIPKFTKNNVEISNQFTANLNVGAYLGYSFGKTRYMYRKNEDKEPSKYLVSAGSFLNVSRIEIDSTTSLSATEPLKTKKTIATISPGIGIMTSIYNFRLGVFVGNDLAIGRTAQKWDYHNRYWWGFGFGYNIGLLWDATK